GRGGGLLGGLLRLVGGHAGGRAVLEHHLPPPASSFSDSANRRVCWARSTHAARARRGSRLYSSDSSDISQQAARQYSCHGLDVSLAAASTSATCWARRFAARFDTIRPPSLCVSRVTVASRAQRATRNAPARWTPRTPGLDLVSGVPRTQARSRTVTT